mmetsp:Transcript_5300/g.13387  ORF Transcript_5300/g.13387 Transcript_5300/m.13387 type:complete len:206 (-) Transcript_5300:21-638(-)
MRSCSRVTRSCLSFSSVCRGNASSYTRPPSMEPDPERMPEGPPCFAGDTPGPVMRAVGCRASMTGVVSVEPGRRTARVTVVPTCPLMSGATLLRSIPRTSTPSTIVSMSPTLIPPCTCAGPPGTSRVTWSGPEGEGSSTAPIPTMASPILAEAQAEAQAPPPSQFEISPPRRRQRVGQRLPPAAVRGLGPSPCRIPRQRRRPARL